MIEPTEQALAAKEVALENLRAMNPQISPEEIRMLFGKWDRGPDRRKRTLQPNPEWGAHERRKGDRRSA